MNQQDSEGILRRAFLDDYLTIISVARSVGVPISNIDIAATPDANSELAYSVVLKGSDSSILMRMYAKLRDGDLMVEARKTYEVANLLRRGEWPMSNLTIDYDNREWPITLAAAEVFDYGERNGWQYSLRAIPKDAQSLAWRTGSDRNTLPPFARAVRFGLCERFGALDEQGRPQMFHEALAEYIAPITGGLVPFVPLSNIVCSRGKDTIDLTLTQVVRPYDAQHNAIR